MTEDAQSRHVILSGCSGGGKSALLAALGQRGFRTVDEPGRRIVAEELDGDGRALPWVDAEAFARRAIDMAVRDRQRVEDREDWVFFDRGLIDAAEALEHATGAALTDTLRGHPRFHHRVFLAPPWPEIFRQDRERRQGLQDGIDEYHRLRDAYDRLGYATLILPKRDVGARADFVLGHLG